MPLPLLPTSFPTPLHSTHRHLPSLLFRLFSKAMRHLARCGVKTVRTASRWSGTAPPQQQQQQLPTPEQIAEHQAKFAQEVATRTAALEEAVAKEPVSRAVAWAKLHLGESLLNSGDKKGAGRELKEGLAVLKQVEPDTLSYARSCISVADILAKELDRYYEAAVLMHEAMELHEKLITETTDPTELSEMYFTVAKWELRKGEYDAAEISFDKCCKNIVDIGLTEEDTKLLIAHKQYDLASLLRLRNEGRRAIRYYMGALLILEFHAPNDQVTADAMYWYCVLIHANTYDGVENTEIKEESELQAIGMCHKILKMQVTKPGSRKEGAICSVLGGLYFKVGLYARALEFRQCALKIQEADGETGTIIAATLHALVPIYMELGRREEAERTATRMKTLMPTVQAKHNKANPQSVGENETTDPMKLMQEELENGQYDEAEITCEKCCDIIARRNQTEEDTTLMVAEHYCLIAYVFLMKGEYHRALKYNMKAIPVFETYAPKEEATAILYYRTSQAHAGIAQGEENAETKKAAELDAIKMCHKSLDIAQGIKRASKRPSINALFSGSRKEADICNVLAQLYHAQGLSTRALEFRERALKIYDAVDDVGVEARGTVIVEILSALVPLYKELGRTEDAERTEARMKTLMATA